MHLIRCSFSSSVQPNLLPQSKHWIERTDTRQRFLRGVGDTLAAPALRRPIVGFVELYAPFSADNDKSCSVTWVSSYWLYVKTLEQCSLRNLPHFGGDLFGFGSTELELSVNIFTKRLRWFLNLRLDNSSLAHKSHFCCLSSLVLCVRM